MSAINQYKGLLTGIFFGTGSGVITTLGLIVGLFAGTESLAAVMGGILVIAVSDSMSDAFGIHLSEEARPDSTQRSVWIATLATLVTKLIMAASFAVPLLFLPLQQGVIACLLWGGLVLTLLSVFIARQQGLAPLPVIAEHLSIGVAVTVISWLVGTGVNRLF
jgi:vacuolar iron transporter family protein